ncbi:hypothetical protein SMACR_08978 [Sordaria macrospora]|uniref:WGS project CABT00000000 data, contig 2.82 n=2 Tax=Sordaria macrospora TaxID=5147 RepID=F7WBR2_SORMK|nr:uncharacterized protein SMAC_08978 [Sordaria macrospora k-hell]KAA8622078.1 hypothetical protein SMACR_08978 [Sordaria macrospora]KAH7635305.1 hypothetical protein B0T09DRAFT_362574 [Sordaria sp. MPI-SDFR-AT-0083]WPJ67250.1 hypothetical protein SMAC4_08978 [Sordaria macrospora]CCC05477.1 unnamed protein product [Sordaria macrospora k-hell]
MQGPLPLTVTGKVQYISTSVMGTLPRAARELSKFPDLQEKAKHEYERFKNWVVISGAEDYDHENYLNNLEHRVEYQQINDLLQRLHVFSYDVEYKIKTHIYDARYNQDYLPREMRRREPKMSDADFKELVISRYMAIERLIDECYAFKPIVY